MKILNEYEMTRAYYALVELDDGRRIELKIYKDPEKKEAPSLEDWSSLAAKVPADIPEPEPTPVPESPTTAEVEVYQDGEKIYG
jgi:hypothetical protein